MSQRYYSSTGGSSSDTNPIDAHYSKLNTDITVIPKDGEGFKTIQEYVNNTHGETHSSYTLEVEQAFKVNRKVRENSSRCDELCLTFTTFTHINYMHTVVTR